MIPLADIADRWLRDLARDSGSAALAAIDGPTLLGERAMLNRFRVPGRVSAGGGCRLYDTCDGTIALNLSRPDDRAMLPALFRADTVLDDAAIVAHAAIADAAALVAQGRLLGLAIAHDAETPPPPVAITVRASAAPPPSGRPRVLDLSALWAGPLAGHLLRLAGATVTKVESLSRPDAMRDGDAYLFTLLNAGKATVRLDLRTPDGRAALHRRIAASDIVIEAARPRALLQLGIDADRIVASRPGLTWLSITGHGVAGDAAGWVGFGDDCGVAGGLTAALRRATGRTGFVGDAIADPLTGLYAARAAWRAWATGSGGRLCLAMSGIVAEAMTEAAPPALDAALRAWAAAEGSLFPPVAHRPPC